MGLHDGSIAKKRTPTDRRNYLVIWFVVGVPSLFVEGLYLLSMENLESFLYDIYGRGEVRYKRVRDHEIGAAFGSSVMGRVGYHVSRIFWSAV